MEGGGLSFRSACFHLHYPLLSTPIQDWTLPGSAAALWGNSHLHHWARQDSLISPHPQKEFA
jgi:hypothetical protein